MIVEYFDIRALKPLDILENILITVERLQWEDCGERRKFSHRAVNCSFVEVFSPTDVAKPSGPSPAPATLTTCRFAHSVTVGAPGPDPLDIIKKLKIFPSKKIHWIF